MKTHAIFALLGIGAAAGTWFVFERVRGDDKRHVAHTAATPEVGRDVVVRREVQVIQDGPTLERIKQLEAELARLKASQGAAQQPPDPEASHPQMTAEQRRERYEQEVSEADRRHEQESQDPSWAPQAKKSLATALSGAGQKLKFTLISTDCRTESCRAEVDWPSGEQAATSGHFLAEMQIPGLNCAQTAWIPEPDGKKGSVRTKLFLDCSDMRAGRADSIEGS